MTALIIYYTFKVALSNLQENMYVPKLVKTCTV